MRERNEKWEALEDQARQEKALREACAYALAHGRPMPRDIAGKCGIEVRSTLDLPIHVHGRTYGQSQAKNARPGGRGGKNEI